ncbi:MAG TPA: hypothetical protein VF189_05550 [Patescibacteria group bacterium]
MSYEDEDISPAEEEFNAQQYAKLQILKKRVKSGKSPRKKKNSDTLEEFGGLTKKEISSLSNVKSFGWNLDSRRSVGIDRLSQKDPAVAQNIDHRPVTSDFRKLSRKFRRFVERKRFK